MYLEYAALLLLAMLAVAGASPIKRKNAGLLDRPSKTPSITETEPKTWEEIIAKYRAGQDSKDYIMLIESLDISNKQANDEEIALFVAHNAGPLEETRENIKQTIEQFDAIWLHDEPITIMKKLGKDIHAQKNLYDRALHFYALSSLFEDARGNFIGFKEFSKFFIKPVARRISIVSAGSSATPWEIEDEIKREISTPGRFSFFADASPYDPIGKDTFALIMRDYSDFMLAMPLVGIPYQSRQVEGLIKAFPIHASLWPESCKKGFNTLYMLDEKSFSGIAPALISSDWNMDPWFRLQALSLISMISDYGVPVTMSGALKRFTKTWSI